MDLFSLLIWGVTLALGLIAVSRPGRLHLQGLKIAWNYFYDLVPRLIAAILVSGFFSVIVPTELVAASIGKESGMKGVLIASLVGGFTPGGPIICFPIVVILYKAGAGIPPLIAFITAWSVFAFHRIVMYEIPVMGIRFAMLRLASSLVLPPLSGILATIIQAQFPLGI
jgi:uncharacterized membrane protein YraQ (UPF0718 family)